MKTILVVDDIPYVRKQLIDILTQARYRVIAEAENGRQAIEQYKKHRPDLVTMDLVMPLMNGIEATYKITRIDKKAIVVVISAMDQEQLVMEAINAGARDYIVKPFQKEDILKSIEHVFIKSTGN